MASEGSPRAAASAPASERSAHAQRSQKPIRRRQVALLLVLLALLAAAPLRYTRVARSAAASAQLERGTLLLARGQPAEAEQAWQTASRLTPDNPNVYRALSALYRSQGRLAE